MPACLVTMLNLSDTHPGALELLKNNGFSVSRSTVPLSRNPVYITNEQTINRHAKSHSGIIGFSRNYSAYYRWCVTRPFRAKYVEATLNMADMTTTETSVHKDLKSSQIKCSEEGVTNVKDTVMGFTDPFTVENKKELHCLSSGLPASSKVSINLLQAKEQGQSALAQFIKKRLIDKTVYFHDPVKQMKYKTCAFMEKCQKVKSSQNKLAEVRAE